MAGHSTIPIACVELHPTKQTVRFCGVPINLSAMCRCYDPPLDQGYLSRIFKGQRVPTEDYIERVAGALGMSVTACSRALAALREGR